MRDRQRYGRWIRISEGGKITSVKPTWFCQHSCRRRRPASASCPCACGQTTIPRRLIHCALYPPRWKRCLSPRSSPSAGFCLTPLAYLSSRCCTLTSSQRRIRRHPPHYMLCLLMRCVISASVPFLFYAVYSAAHLLT